MAKSKSPYQQMIAAQKLNPYKYAKSKGFDYSAGAAKTVTNNEYAGAINANANAVNQNNTTKANTMNSLLSTQLNSSRANDTNYFKKYLTQQQDQVASGINGGIAQNQNTMLQMDKNNALSDIYNAYASGVNAENARYANENLRLQNDLADINKQRENRKTDLQNQYRQQALDLYNKNRDYWTALYLNSYKRK